MKRRTLTRKKNHPLLKMMKVQTVAVKMKMTFLDPTKETMMVMMEMTMMRN